MTINLLQKEDEKKWDEFVNNHPQGHYSQFTCYKKTLEETYKYEGHYLYIKEGSRILSLLPLFKFKKKFVSQPFSEYGGILFNLGLDFKEKENIIQIWKDYFTKQKPAFLEIHGQLDETELMKSNFNSASTGKIAILKLNSDYQILYDNFDYQIKKAIKKAEREKVKVYEETSEESIKSKFYPLYTKYSKGRHGSPPHSLDLFLNHYKFSPENMKIYFAEIDNVLVAALSGFLSKNRVDLACNPCLEKYFIYRPDDLLHAYFIKWACQNNFKYFDFGPARYEGQIRYKKKWGVEFHEHFYLSDKQIKLVSPETNFMKILSFFWKNFLPESLANKLGPEIRKRIGK
ncbi:MAG: GNAT family N-acetyltransferase [Candidatus Nealsonbacteria bacterium]